MSDIVERLRKPRAGVWDDHKDMYEAAAEIERLRAENIATGRLNDQLVKSLADAAVEIKRLRRENEVMKAADYEALTKPAT